MSVASIHNAEKLNQKIFDIYGSVNNVSLLCGEDICIKHNIKYKSFANSALYS